MSELNEKMAVEMLPDGKYKIVLVREELVDALEFTKINKTIKEAKENHQKNLEITKQNLEKNKQNLAMMEHNVQKEIEVLDKRLEMMQQHMKTAIELADKIERKLKKQERREKMVKIKV